MIASWVLDSLALVGFLEGRPVGTAAKELLALAISRRATVLVHEITVSETVAAVWRKLGRERSESVEDLIRASPIRRVATTYEFLRGVWGDVHKFISF